MKARKFSPGRVLRTMNQVHRAVAAGRWVFMRHKPLHPWWISSMTFHTIAAFLAGRSLRVAVENTKGKT